MTRLTTSSGLPAGWGPSWSSASSTGPSPSSSCSRGPRCFATASAMGRGRSCPSVSGAPPCPSWCGALAPSSGRSRRRRCLRPWGRARSSAWFSTRTSSTSTGSSSPCSRCIWRFPSSRAWRMGAATGCSGMAWVLPSCATRCCPACFPSGESSITSSSCHPCSRSSPSTRSWATC